MKNLLGTTFLLVMALPSGCTNGNNNNNNSPYGGGGGGSPNGGGGNTSLLGDWSGHFSLKGTSAGSPLNDVTSQANFQSLDDTHGNFSIKLPDQNASATGSYADQGTSLLLNLADSSIPTIGRKGETAVLNYELTGTTILDLHNDRVDIILNRPAGQPTTPAPGPAPAPATPSGSVQQIYGAWGCVDKAADAWRVEIRSNGTFTIDVANPGNAGSIWMTGGAAIVRGTVANTDVVLTVGDSDVTKYKGLTLQGQLLSDSTVALRRLGPNAEVVETLQCDRQ